MKFNKILSTALAIVCALGSFSVFAPKAAADEVVIDKAPLTSAVVTAKSAGKVDNAGNPLLKYTSITSKEIEDENKNMVVNTEWASFDNRLDKIASMMYINTVGDVEIYYEAYTGEVAFLNKVTGDILFTNPYDVAANYTSSTSAATRKKILSQIVISFLDNGKEKTFYSFEEAAERNQITMKLIKDGVRVEYQIGEPAIQRLTPRMISVERMKKFIIEPMNEFIAQVEANPDEYKDIISSFGRVSDVKKAAEQFMDYYKLYDYENAGSERQAKEMAKAFPVVKSFPIYVCETNISAAELKKLEKLVKFCCPKYTYEELDFDNQQTGFKNTDQSPPRFSMALEYVVDEKTGAVDVTLPANGISFDETLYQLQDITVLPYMGTGHNRFKGYTFFPDGSGAIFRYEELREDTFTLSGQMYGSDYAYHEIAGQNVQTLRYPVFGAVTNFTDTFDPNHNKYYEGYNDAGFLAIITEGDSLATISTEHGGPLHGYNSVYAMFTPRPSDTYNLGGSTGDAASWTVTSKRRYTESYTIKYVMLSSFKNEAGENETYEPSYIGMAKAYRDYLTSTGDLSKLTAKEDDIPLYIESFGSMKGTDRVLSFPVTIDVPLTTFSDIKTMTEELAKGDKDKGLEGISNINFKLTGFANGGLESTAPYKLSWQEVLGGDDGIEDLVKYAEKKNIGIYPDFDFAYVDKNESFDGVSFKKQAVKTIDGRYTRKQVYDSGYQEFQPVGGAAISASTFSYFWNEFSENYGKYNLKAISLSTIGSDLNSDFDEDDPHHREDSKVYTTKFLDSVKKDNQIMVSGGNSYSLTYADVITDVPLTSSKFIKSSQTVPFAGIVLHGSKAFTGTPLNMEGDMDEAVLNAIENGASPFFTLSYQNTQELKTDEYWSQYYSIAYDIWQDDVKEYYNVLNGALADLQNQYIVDHSFIEAYDPSANNAAKDLISYAKRTPSADEAAIDAEIIAEMNELNAGIAISADARYANALKRAERMFAAGSAEYVSYMEDYYQDLEEDLKTTVKDITLDQETAPASQKLTENELKLIENGGLVTYTRNDAGIYVPAADGQFIFSSGQYNEMKDNVDLQYTVQKGTVVEVTYENGTKFLLNYNSFDVSVDLVEGETVNTYEIGAMSFVRID